MDTEISYKMCKSVRGKHSGCGMLLPLSDFTLNKNMCKNCRSLNRISDNESISRSSILTKSKNSKSGTTEEFSDLTPDNSKSFKIFNNKITETINKNKSEIINQINNNAKISKLEIINEVDEKVSNNRSEIINQINNNAKISNLEIINQIDEKVSNNKLEIINKVDEKVSELNQTLSNVFTMFNSLNEKMGTIVNENIQLKEKLNMMEDKFILNNSKEDIIKPSIIKKKSTKKNTTTKKVNKKCTTSEHSIQESLSDISNISVDSIVALENATKCDAKFEKKLIEKHQKYLNLSEEFEKRIEEDFDKHYNPDLERKLLSKNARVLKLLHFHAIRY